MHLRIDKKFNFIFYCLLILILTSTNNYNFDNKFRFRIEIVEVQGFSSKKNKIIANKVKNIKGKNIFFLKKDHFLKFIDRDDTKNLNIKKIYPNKLLLDFIQAKPLCLIISQNNRIILGDNKKKLNLEITDNNLPIVFGSNNINKIFEVVNLLKSSQLDFNSIKNINFFKSERFDVVFKNEVTVKFPIKYSKEMIDHSSKLLNDLKFANSKIIDLRINNRIIKYELQ